MRTEDGDERRDDLRHTYNGQCPDEQQPDSRDPQCPVCIALSWHDQVAASRDRLIAAIAAHRDAIAAAGDVRVFDSESARRAATKYAADRALWALVDGETNGAR